MLRQIDGYQREFGGLNEDALESDGSELQRKYWEALAPNDAARLELRVRQALSNLALGKPGTRLTISITDEGMQVAVG